MQTAQDFIFVSSNMPSEEAFCRTTTNLAERMTELSLLPFETEEERRDCFMALTNFKSDVQALLNSMQEGPRSDINIGYLRAPIGFEKGIGSAAA